MTRQDRDRPGPPGGDGVAEALCHILGNTCDLAVASLMAQWGVEGRDSYTRRGVLSVQAGELWAALTPIGERIVALRRAAVPDFGDQVVRAGAEARVAPTPDGAAIRLAATHEDMLLSLRAAGDLAREAEDEGTLALIGARILAHERHAWVLRDLG